MVDKYQLIICYHALDLDIITPDDDRRLPKRNHDNKSVNLIGTIYILWIRFLFLNISLATALFNLGNPTNRSEEIVQQGNRCLEMKRPSFRRSHQIDNFLYDVNAPY